MNKKFILIRSSGIVVLAMIAFFVPAMGENHKLLAGILLFIALLVSVLIEIYFPVSETGWSEILFDLVCIVTLVHFIPNFWSVVFLIGTLLIGAFAVLASRIGYRIYAYLMVLLVFGMSFAGYLHEVENWLSSVLVVSALLPSILLFVSQENKRIEKLIEAEFRLKNLSTLSGGVAHDFNNLLTAIIGNLELAQLVMPENLESAQYVDEAHAATRKARLLSAQLLSFAGRKPSSKTIVNFSRELKLIASLTEKMVHRGITFTFNDMPDDCFIECDEAQFQQIIMNLLLNAAEASVSPSVVTLSLEIEVLSPAEKWAVLMVRDQGVGVPEEIIAQVFDPFMTTKSSGHGLGLASARRVVESLGGKITLESSVGQGTSVNLRLPAVNYVSQLNDDAKVPKKSDHGGQVLIIDDDEHIRSIAKIFLERLGYSTLTAADGYEGMALFEKYSSEISSVLLDLKMPGKDGWQCLKEIREMKSNMPVVISSGYNPSEKQVTENNVLFLSKPYTSIELENTFSAILELS